MTATWAQAVALGLAAYLAFGAVFALAFAARGAAAVDAAAHGMPWSARVLILPGATALWPYLAWVWLRRRPPPVA